MSSRQLGVTKVVVRAGEARKYDDADAVKINWYIYRAGFKPIGTISLNCAPCVKGPHGSH